MLGVKFRKGLCPAFEGKEASINNLVVVEDGETREYNEHNLRQVKIASSKHCVWSENGLIKDSQEVATFTVYVVPAARGLPYPPRVAGLNLGH